MRRASDSLPVLLCRMLLNDLGPDYQVHGKAKQVLQPLEEVLQTGTASGKLGEALQHTLCEEVACKLV